MNILHIITSLKMGGAESALFHFLRYAKQHYDTQHAVAYVHDGPFVEQIRSLGIPVYSIRGWLFNHDVGTYVALCKLIKTIKPDLLHSSLWSANVLARLLAYQFSLPLISELHGDCRYVSQHWKNTLESYTLFRPQRQRIVAVSDGVAQAYKDLVISGISNSSLGKAYAHNLTVIKNGIDVDFLHQQAECMPLSRTDIGLAQDDFVIGAIGRLNPIKSYDILIKAFKQAWLPGMKLCLVGDGSDRENLQQLVIALQLQGEVLFIGQRTDAFRFYSLFDCFALSSQTEGLSLALLEALSFGLPIISTNSTVQHEVITDKINGLLVPINDVAAYAHAIGILHGSVALRRAMQHANLKLIKQFTIPTVVAAYHRLYAELIQQER